MGWEVLIATLQRNKFTFPPSLMRCFLLPLMLAIATINASEFTINLH